MARIILNLLMSITTFSRNGQGLSGNLRRRRKPAHSGGSRRNSNTTRQRPWRKISSFPSSPPSKSPGWLTMFDKAPPPQRLIEQFFAAVRTTDKHVIQALLDSEHGVQLVQYCDGTGTNALLLASQTGDPAIAHLLLKNGALHNKGNFEGITPIHRCASLGHNEFCLVLIKRRDRAGQWVNVDQFSKKGLTPLMIATINGHGSIVDTLLWIAEAKKDLRDTQGNMRALDFARQWGEVNVVQQITLGKRVLAKSNVTDQDDSKLSIKTSPSDPWLDPDDEQTSMLVFNCLQRGWRPVYLE